MNQHAIIYPLLLGAAVLPANTFAKKSTTPNIIFLMADDMGWGDTGFNGNKIIQTPNLDALAGEGVILDRFYAACAVSSPTRSSVLTGRNPYRTGIYHANVGIMRCEEITTAEILKEHGYTSGHFGKWHLGTLTDQMRDGNRGKVGNSADLNPPRLHGYDDSFTTEKAVPTYDPMIAIGKDMVRTRKPYGTNYWLHDGNFERDNLSGDDSRIIMDRVIPFIDKAKENKQPFMSVVWFHAPHLPCVASEEMCGRYSQYSLQQQHYFGCITALDEQVGRLVKHLKEQKLFDNTIICFCSDNGPEGKSDKSPGSTGGLQGRKRSLLEGGIRVPAFVVWGDKIKGGRRISTPASTSDYLPTVVDIINHKPSDDRAIDGESLLPLIANKGAKPRQQEMVFMIREQCAVIGNQYKLYFKGGKYSLYDITNDPKEQTNVIAQNPEITKQYKGIMSAYIASCHDSFLGMDYAQPFTPKVQQTWTDPKIYKPVQKKKK